MLFAVWVASCSAYHCVNRSGYQGHSKSFWHRLCNNFECIFHCQVAWLKTHCGGMKRYLPCNNYLLFKPYIARWRIRVLYQNIIFSSPGHGHETGHLFILHQDIPKHHNSTDPQSELTALNLAILKTLWLPDVEIRWI